MHVLQQSLQDYSNYIILILQDDHNLKIVAILARKSSRLEVSNANIDFNGEYQCIISNIAGSVRHSFTIELMHG